MNKKNTKQQQNRKMVERERDSEQGEKEKNSREKLTEMDVRQPSDKTSTPKKQKRIKKKGKRKMER